LAADVRDYFGNPTSSTWHPFSVDASDVHGRELEDRKPIIEILEADAANP